MIKTPVRKGIWNGQWPILDVRGTVRLHVHREEEADQIVSALNAQPKCKTCGSCEHFMSCTHERKVTHNKQGECSDYKPCPSCPQPSGDLLLCKCGWTGTWEEQDALGSKCGCCPDCGNENLIWQSQAAARISVLEGKQKTSTAHLIAAQDLLDGPVEKLSQCDCRHCNNTYCPILALVQGAKNALTKEAALGEKGKE